MDKMIEAEFLFDLPDHDESGYKKIQAQLQEEYAKTDNERRIRYELMLKIFKIPPPGTKVKLCLKHGLGVHEGILSIPEEPKWPYVENSILLQIENLDFMLSNNPPSTFQFLNTDIKKWEFQNDK